MYEVHILICCGSLKRKVHLIESFCIMISVVNNLSQHIYLIYACMYTCIYLSHRYLLILCARLSSKKISTNLSKIY